MKKIASIFIIAIMVCSIVGCSQKKANPINLPEENTILSIDVTIGDETENYTDSEWIRQCILYITNAQATSKESIQDMPHVDDYIKIDINTDKAVSTLFVYIEKDNYYVEQPYQGIYKTDSAFYEMLSDDVEELREKYPEYFELAAFKGIEVYVWSMAENTYCCGMMSGTNRNKTDEEIWGLQEKVLSVEETRAILNEIGVEKSDIIVIPISQPYSSYFYEIDDEYREKVTKFFK